MKGFHFPFLIHETLPRDGVGGLKSIIPVPVHSTPAPVKMKKRGRKKLESLSNLMI